MLERSLSGADRVLELGIATLIIFTGGDCFGGINWDHVQGTFPKAPRDFSLSVAGRSEFDLRDPENERFGGQQYDPTYKAKYSNLHTRGCGFVQNGFAMATCPGADATDPSAFERSVPFDYSYH